MKRSHLEMVDAVNGATTTYEHAAAEQRLAEALREIESVAQGYVKDVASDYLPDLNTNTPAPVAPRGMAAEAKEENIRG